MPTPQIAGLYIGPVTQFNTSDGQPMRSGIRKQPVELHQLDGGGFEGDANALPEHHTLDKAVHFFSDEYYPKLEACIAAQLPRPAFGENLSTTGLPDSDTYIGDHLRIGDALVCVTQPTERCRTIGRSLGEPKILKALHQLELCGFYARVVEPGEVRSGSEIALERRDQMEWSISRLHNFMFKKIRDQHLAEEVLQLAGLSNEWKDRVQIMSGRATRGEPLSSNLVGL